MIDGMMTLDTRPRKLVRLAEVITNGIGAFDEANARRRLHRITRDWANKPFSLHEEVRVYWHERAVVFVCAVNQAAFEATYPLWEIPSPRQWWEFEEHIFDDLRGSELPIGDSPERRRETSRQKRQRERRAVGRVLRQNRMH